MLRILLASLLFIAAGAPASAEKTRLAVIGPDSTEPARSLLITEISKRPDMAVLERAELEKVAGELALPSNGFNGGEEIRVGKLLNADALLALSFNAEKHLITMRLIAVAPGVALFEESIPAPLPAPEEWARIVAKKLSPFLGALAKTEAPRIPLSILRIRDVTGGGASVENELGFLLTRRLMSEPSLWVLERSQMGLLEWESALKASPQSTFWTGSYLLDGTMTPVANGFDVSVRLRSASKGEEILLSAHAADVLQLAEAIASKVTSSLKIDHHGAPWDAASEARQYYDEALWAIRWFQYKEASEASDAAWALGLRNDTLAFLRFHSLAIQVAGSPVTIDWRKWEKPERWVHETASLALDRLQEGLTWKGQDLSAEWIGLGADCLWDCSLVLRASYHAAPPDSSEAEAGRALASRIREIAESMEPASKRFPIPRVDDNNVGFKLPFLGQPPLRGLYVVRGIDGPLWQKDAPHCVSEIKRLFDDIDHLDPKIRSTLKETILQGRPDFYPWIAYWNPEERSRVPLSALKAALLDSPSRERAIDVALLLAERRAHASVNYYADRLDPDQVLIVLLDVQKVLWDARDALLRKEISIERFSSAMNAVEHIESKVNGYASPRIDAELSAFRLKYFEFLLSAKVNDPAVLWAFLPQINKLSPEDKLDLLPRVREALNQGKAAPLQRLERELAEATNSLPPAKTSAAASRPPEALLRPAWTISEKDIMGNDTIQQAQVRYRQGRLYVMGSNLTNNWKAEPKLLFTFDPVTKVGKRLVVKGQPFRFFDFDAVNGELFVAEGNNVSRYVATEDRWIDLPVPEVSMPKVFGIDGLLYVAGFPGIIVRLDPSTGKSDVLASSRRKPALTVLDDVPPYQISKVFKDAEGRLCALLETGLIYRRDEMKSSWDKVFDVEKATRGEAFDRRLLLNAIGTDGLLRTNQGVYASLDGVVGLLASDQGTAPPVAAPRSNRFPTLPRPGLRPAFAASARSIYAVFDGKDLWLLTSDATGKGPALKRSSAAGDSERLIPIDMGAGNWPLGVGTRMESTPEGIFIYANNQACFFRQEDLDHWPQKP